VCVVYVVCVCEHKTAALPWHHSFVSNVNLTTRVCMYMCVCVCVCMCVSVYVYVWMYVCMMCVCVCVCVVPRVYVLRGLQIACKKGGAANCNPYVQLSIATDTQKSKVCMYICMCVYVCMYVCVCGVCMCVYEVCGGVYMCVVCACVCVCVCGH